MTNEQWLNTLNTEEKARLIAKGDCCAYCIYCGGKCKGCVEGIAEWLNQEANPMPELAIGDIVEIAPVDTTPAKRYVILPNCVAILVNDFSQPQPARRITLERLRALSCRMVWRYFPNEYLVIWRADNE